MAKCFIKESAYLQEAKDVQVMATGKVRFKAKLQILDEYSYNGKNYLKEPMVIAIDNKNDLIRINSFVGEMDHPMDPTPMRMVNVLFQNTSHIFKEIWTEGNVVWGLVENTSNIRGTELYAFIVKDKIPVGFSLRAMGDVRNTPKGYEVYNDIDITTWDTVSTPSFSGCILQEITNKQHLESFMKTSNAACLEEYVNGDTEFRRQMLLESKITKPATNLISYIENNYVCDTQEIKIKALRNMLKLETSRKIHIL